MAEQDVDRPLLVVDDDAAVARLVAAVLSREGHGVEMAVDGESALARLTSGDFALVLTDMTMPGLSGLGLVRAAEAAGVRAPFLLMSAFLDAATERELCEEPGIVGILRKPFEISALVADVRAVLGQHGVTAPTLALAPLWLFRQAGLPPPPKAASTC